MLQVLNQEHLESVLSFILAKARKAKACWHEGSLEGIYPSLERVSGMFEKRPLSYPLASQQEHISAHFHLLLFYAF